MTHQPRCVATGYASLDYRFRTEPFKGSGQTTLVRRPLDGGRPSPGAVSYFARGLARNGLVTSVVTWVGGDALGRRFRDDLVTNGIDASAVAMSGHRSPSARMFYDDAGESITFFDAGEVDQELTGEQAAALADADAVVFGIGPHEATARALQCIRPTAIVLWAVKADAASLPGQLAAALADRASVICLNAAERAFVEELCAAPLTHLSRCGATVIVTDGERGVRIYTDGDEMLVPQGDVVRVDDTTGAGDTFAGSVLGQIALDTTISTNTERLRQAVERASAEVQRFLTVRLAKEEHD